MLPRGSWKSTGCTRKTDAENFANDRLLEWDPPISVPKGKRLRDFLEPYFVWEKCPRKADRLADGKRISKQHALAQRRVLDRYVLTDTIADMDFQKITRGDILEFKRRLIAKHGKRRIINSVLTALVTVYNDGYDREILKRNPARNIGKIVYDRKKTEIFTEQEIADLFPRKGLGSWLDLQSYTCFLIAASCGLRRGEILALKWKDIEFDNNILHVERAWISDTELGDEPKWGQIREVRLPEHTTQKLKELRADSIHVLPEALVFHNEDGTRKGGTWYNNRFQAAMKKAKIDYKARNLTGHSFRHACATILADHGLDDRKIQAALGWTNPKTQGIYTHIRAEHLGDQAKILDGIFN